MNKTLIVLLAVCLISVHAFVKRDAPQAGEVDTIAQKVNDLGKVSLEAIQNALNPENIKKNFGEFVDSVDKAVKSFQASSEPPK